ncbi:PD-(D/E)XK nuclease-like domain-containing protein [Niallia sp. NCCP-28]|uniref:PD-(D/E)XK nuclease-like domain-containing protein n=1 Tax=Niallia sp. NCCP-28 TaxID=2934712 RepID=UPI002087ECE8|nr:PD-(D/E)XK nuclease-like domain-containing protein [Niallia sp. NCCP-28]GKU81232.1 hypothetical protein NCCP28_06280 [Niallia sp. NCCP-28]
MPKKKKLQLNRENYHSIEADLEYMSVSQFKSFVECEARTMAKLKGEYKPAESNALLVGSYVHVAFEGTEAYGDFIEKNSKAIFNSRGNKYADFEKADQMIKTILEDPFSMFALQGEKEVIYTAELYGAPWKIKVDSINHNRFNFSDLKTTQDLHKRYWSNKYDGWVSFIEAWDYILQMALYRKVIEVNTGKMYKPYIVAVTKENPPNKAVLHFDESRFGFEYEYIEMKMERFLQVKQEKVAAVNCGKCDYCRSIKKLSDTMEIGALIYA